MYCKRLCFVAAAAVAFAVVQAGSVLAAGDVTADLDGSVLTITGDQADNKIAVYSDKSGTVWVEGREETTINGQTEPVGFTVGRVLGVRILMGDGDDAADVRLALPEVDVLLRFYGGRGGDEFVVKGGEFWYIGAWTDSLSREMPDGDDQVTIEDVIVAYEVAVCTYDGDDEVKIENLIVTYHFEYLSVDTGKGKDDVVLRDIYKDPAGAYETRINLRLGAGHDHIVADTIVTDDVFNLWAGPGNDVVELRGNSEMFLTGIGLGDGSDVLDAEKGASLLSTFSWVSGEWGRDTLINSAYFQSAFPPAIDGFEVIDD